MLGDILLLMNRAVGLFKVLLFALLALLAALNLGLLPEHPHFEYERWPLFWAVFGLLGSVVMVLVLKKLLFPVIHRQENFYDC